MGKKSNKDFVIAQFCMYCGEIKIPGMFNNDMEFTTTFCCTKDACLVMLEKDRLKKEREKHRALNVKQREVQRKCHSKYRVQDRTNYNTKMSLYKKIGKLRKLQSEGVVEFEGESIVELISSIEKEIQNKLKRKPLNLVTDEDYLEHRKKHLEGEKRRRERQKEKQREKRERES